MVPMINNGAPSISGNVTVGGSVTFSCSMGFIINGTATVTCQMGGSFSPSTPSCVPGKLPKCIVRCLHIFEI